MSSDERNGGSQVVERTCSVLRELARHGVQGARLIEVTTATGLSRPSAHRILASLVAERFVRRTPSRRYQLSPIMHELARSAPSPTGDLEPLRRIVQALADECGDTVYLAIRQGEHAHYLLRCEGAYPIRTHVVSANQSLHLVSGHSGRALLAALPPEEAEAIIARAERDRSLFGEATPDSLRDEVEFICRHGYGYARDVTFIGVAGLTMPVPSDTGPSYLALTISSIPQRLTMERAERLREPLAAAAAAISDVIRETRSE